MHRLFITICISIFPSFLFAQIDSFDIADYARPDLRRETASFVPIFSFVNNIRNYSEDNKSNLFRLNLGGTYSKSLFFNSIDRQTFSNLNYKVSLDYTKNNGKLQADDFTYFFNVNPRYSINRVNKYFKGANSFFEYDLLGNLNLALWSFNSENTSKINKLLLNGSFAIPLFWGKGRLELVNDYWHSQTILEMLGEADLIKVDVNEEVIIQFANKIAEIKNIRNTDIRLENIAEYEVLCHYLIENGIVDGEQYKFFAHLNDAWAYESFTTRFNGTEIKFGVVPQLQIRSLDDGFRYVESGFNEIFRFNEISAIGSNFHPYQIDYWYPWISGTSSSSGIYQTNAHEIRGGADIVLSYHSYKAISLDIQKDFFVKLNFGPRVSKIIGSPSESYYNEDFRLVGNLNLSYKLSFIPNARTNYFIDARLGYNYIQNIDEENRAYFEKRALLNSNITGGYNKYITPQLSWYINTTILVSNWHYEYERFVSTVILRAGVNYRLY